MNTEHIEPIVVTLASVWVAFREPDVMFALSDAVCWTGVPTPLYEVVQQRRRWAAGNPQVSGCSCSVTSC